MSGTSAATGRTLETQPVKAEGRVSSVYSLGEARLFTMEGCTHLFRVDPNIAEAPMHLVAPDVYLIVEGNLKDDEGGPFFVVATMELRDSPVEIR